MLCVELDMLTYSAQESARGQVCLGLVPSSVIPCGIGDWSGLLHFWRIGWGTHMSIGQIIAHGGLGSCILFPLCLMARGERGRCCVWGSRVCMVRSVMKSVSITVVTQEAKQIQCLLWSSESGQVRSSCHVILWTGQCSISVQTS